MPHISNRTTFVAALLAALTLAACDAAQPTGQVVARVDGREITMRDLAAEFRAAGVAPDPANKPLVNEVLDKVISRKLVVERGKELGLDRSPDYLAASQRADETLLGDATLARWNGDLPDPGPAEIAAFKAKNPHLFGQRAIVQLAQIKSGPVQLDPAQMASIKTMAEMEALLRDRQVPMESHTSTIDTAQVSAPVVAQLRAAASGEPMIEKRADGLLISSVVSMRPAPLPAAAQQRLATEGVRRAALQRKVDALKRAAKIEYQPGYAAAAPPAGR